MTPRSSPERWDPSLGRRNFSQIARRAGTSREGLYKALSAEGNPSLVTVIKVSHALGLRLRFDAIA